MAKIPPPKPQRKPRWKSLPYEGVKSLKADEKFLREITAPKEEKK
jgi:hypothetical protein